MDKQKERRRLGALFGQGIGDALGVHDEYRPASQIAREGRDLFAYVETNRKRGYTPAGGWSDDTEQAMCLIQAYLEDRDLVPTTVARHLQQWLARDSRGGGKHTERVLNDKLFASDPMAVAEEIWIQSDRDAATNGAVMRCSVVGTMRPNDLYWTERMAVRQARITHFDPRCVASSVAVAVAVAALVVGKAPKEAFNEAWKRSAKYHPDAIKYMMVKDLASLKLDEGLVDGAKVNTAAPVNHTFQALGAGFLALRLSTHTFSFSEALAPILAAGGDVDTNACVAGALVGAFLGIGNIDTPLVQGLQGKDQLVQMADHIRRIEP